MTKSFSGVIFSKKVIDDTKAKWTDFKPIVEPETDTNPYRNMTDEEYEEYENYMDGLAGDWEG